MANDFRSSQYFEPGIVIALMLLVVIFASLAS